MHPVLHPGRARFAFALAVAASSALAQSRPDVSPSTCPGLPYADAPGSVALPPGWFSGDPHDHIQLCDGTLLATEDVVARMVAEGLDVGHPLIWDGLPDTPFDYTNQVCRVTGLPEPTTAGKIVQFGVETSGLQGASWGHLIGLNLTADEAAIAIADPAQGACYTSATGLGFVCAGGDGTGVFSAPIADAFGARPQAVRGVAHQAWATGVYSDATFAYAWFPQLVPTGRATDIVGLDPTRKLALPVLGALSTPQVLTPFAAMDVARGKVEYLEAVDLESNYSGFTTLDARWYGSYYKLLSAGLRVSVAAGSDVDCANITGRTSKPRTFVRVQGPLDYDGWVRGLAQGRVSLAMGDDLFLDLRVEGLGIGSQVSLPSPAPGQAAEIDVRATLRATTAVQDRIELVVNGKVADARPVQLAAGGGVATFRVPALALEESSWIAARLCSNRAHTGATYVTLGDRAIGDLLAAEYWMVWCDLLELTIDQFPVFSCQEGEVKQHVREGRKLFRGLRDYVEGFDPAWQATRIGRSTPACDGPMVLGLEGPLVEGSDELVVQCFHAPKRGSGRLYVSDRRPAGGSTTLQGVEVFFDPEADFLVSVPVVSEPNGTCVATIGGLEGLRSGARLVAQFLWESAPSCPSGSASGSDAVELTVLAARPSRVRRIGDPLPVPR